MSRCRVVLGAAVVVRCFGRAGPAVADGCGSLDVNGGAPRFGKKRRLGKQGSLKQEFQANFQATNSRSF